MGDRAPNVGLTRRRRGERLTPLNLLATLFLMQTREMLGIFAMKMHCWLTVGLLSNWTARSFSTELRTSQSALPSMYLHMQLLLPRGRISHFPLAELREDPLSSSRSFPGSSVWQHKYSRASGTPPHFVSSANFLRVNAAHCSRFL